MFMLYSIEALERLCVSAGHDHLVSLGRALAPQVVGGSRGVHVPVEETGLQLPALASWRTGNWSRAPPPAALSAVRLVGRTGTGPM